MDRWLKPVDTRQMMQRSQGASFHPDGILALTDDSGHFRPLELIEQHVIAIALDRSSGSITLAARMLGISRSSLYRRLRGAER